MRSQSRRLGPIELDGRTLEGGGQLLRNALCLSALTRTPIQITDIRGRRSGGGGLKAQHIACAKWLSQACDAGLDEVEKGTKTILFEPGKIHDQEQEQDSVSPAFRKISEDGEIFYECRFSIGTAGSLGLALQAVLPFILFSRLPSQIPVQLVMSGGTNVSGSPSYDHVAQVLLPTLHGIGFPLITPKLRRRGWSHGGASIGEFTLEIPPRSSIVLSAFKWRPDDLEESKPVLQHLRATVVAPVSTLEHFRRHLSSEIQKIFAERYSFISPDQSIDDILTIDCEDSKHEKRIYLLLVATLTSSATTSSNLASLPQEEAQQAQSTQPNQPSYYLARDWLYERKHRDVSKVAAEMSARVTRELAVEIRSGGWVDEHMRDQLVIYQALAQGRSEVWAGVEVGEEEYDRRMMRTRMNDLRDPFEDEDEGEGEAQIRLREPSLHARTAEWVAKEVLGVRFTAEGACEGIGFGAEEYVDQGG